MVGSESTTGSGAQAGCRESTHPLMEVDGRPTSGSVSSAPLAAEVRALGPDDEATSEFDVLALPHLPPPSSEKQPR